MRFILKPGDSRFTLVQRAVFVCTVFVCIVTLTLRATPLLHQIYATDRYYIASGITLYFAVLLVKVLRQILFVTNELELTKKHLARRIRSTTPGLRVPAPEGSLMHEAHDALSHMRGDRSHDEILSIIADTLDRRVAHIALHAKTLVNLGFIGTLVGIMVALTEADLTSLFRPGADVGAVLDAVLTGMKIAIGTSIVGIVAKIWIDHLGIILEEGSHHLVSSIVKMELLDETSPHIPLSE